jgi:hypothetical protein
MGWVTWGGGVAKGVGVDVDDDAGAAEVQAVRSNTTSEETTCEEIASEKLMSCVHLSFANRLRDGWYCSKWSGDWNRMMD